MISVRMTLEKIGMMRLSTPPNEEQTLLASVEEFLRPLRAANCSCGSVYSSSDAVFWGECEKCRNPARHRSRVADSRCHKADRNYHGGGWPEDCS